MKALIVDGSNLVFRCYYVAESLSGGKGDGLLHVHLFLSSLKGYVDLYKPDKIVCCWDKRTSGEDNFRKTLLSEYKDNRDKEKAREVHTETELIEELISYLGVFNFYPERLEADDCIAYLCHTLEGEKVIVSNDKDMHQLIGPDVVYYDPKSKLELNDRNFEFITGNKLSNYLIEKAFAGDKSDNVPGIKGFGPVKVKRYLAGEIALTAEQQAQYDKNIEIFDLNYYKGFASELAHFQSQKITRKPQWDAFLELCKEKGLSNILKGKDSYYNLFCGNFKMKSMLSNLFG